MNKATWWSTPSTSDDPNTRTLQGEVHLPASARPTVHLGLFKYTVRSDAIVLAVLSVRLTTLMFFPEWDGSTTSGYSTQILRALFHKRRKKGRGRKRRLRSRRCMRLALDLLRTRHRRTRKSQAVLQRRLVAHPLIASPLRTSTTERLVSAKKSV